MACKTGSPSYAPPMNLEGRDHLGEQIRHRGRITDFWSVEFAGNSLMMFIDRKMELAPGSESHNVVFLLMPFVFAADLQSGGVNEHKATRLHRQLADLCVKRL